MVGASAWDDDLPASVASALPDVLLWDAGWGEGELPESLAGLVPRLPRILALLPDRALADRAWEAGLAGLLLRDSELEALLAALHAVAAGLRVLGPGLEVTTRLPEVRDEALVEALTVREHQVLLLLAEGLTNKAIAARLEVSESTIKFHVNAVLRKLGVESRTEAVVRASRLGLILL